MIRNRESPAYALVAPVMATQLRGKSSIGVNDGASGPCYGSLPPTDQNQKTIGALHRGVWPQILSAFVKQRTYQLLPTPNFTHRVFSRHTADHFGKDQQTSARVARGITTQTTQYFLGDAPLWRIWRITVHLLRRRGEPGLPAVGRVQRALLRPENRGRVWERSCSFKTVLHIADGAPAQVVGPETFLRNVGEELWNRFRHNRFSIC
jgi:hypothetical protein